MAYPNYENPFRKDIQVGDKIVTITVGKFSEQVSAAVLAQCGETVVHTTVALGRKVDLGYFPLSVEYQEKLYAAGIIKGSRWVKRDGRPTDDAILKGRVVDRTMRPLFPDGITNEVQIISTIFSYDQENDPDMLALLSAAIALQISDIPFDGPVAGVRLGYSKETDQFIFNPTHAQRAAADLDLIVSGTANSIVMVEAGANEVSEEVILRGLATAQQEFAQICADIQAMADQIGKPKQQLVSIDELAQAKSELQAQLGQQFAAEVRALVLKEAILEPIDLSELTTAMLSAANNGKDESDALWQTEGNIKNIIHSLMKKTARQMILAEKVRPDGRKLDEIRPIWVEVDVFPRTHGSAMFKRGATQAITIATLGAPDLGQYVEDMDGEEVRRYMHFYNMPPYASGEAGRVGSPKRREIGHGALAERALLPMIPSQEEFPYAIQVVSEIVSSNGSTSQASVCGSTLSLMAAGVPIKRPVAGIAMGLMSDGMETYEVLSDIQGLEDHVGDMDFKVAGTTEGITAIQMDIKLKGIPAEVMQQALTQAKLGRLHILDKMLAVIAQPRTKLSAYAPKIEQVIIPASKIGELIGPGGKMIKSIIETTGAQVDVSEDVEQKIGNVTISSPDQEKIDAAVKIITGMMMEIEEGMEFDGTVTRVESYGAFVEFTPNREGLVHVSNMSTEYVADANELMKVGDTVHVWVNEIKEDGKIGLTSLTPEERANKSTAADRRGGNGGRGGDDRGGRGGFGGRSGGRGDSRGGFGNRSRGGYGRDDRGGRGNYGGGQR